jgi:hypothetical protein
MIPMEIYRSDDDEEYYVQFTEEEIDKIHSKFMMNGSKENVFNLEHNKENTVPAYLLEAWIVEDSKSDKAFKSYGIDVPKGTLMVTTQITDIEAYNKLVENGQTGYSIEGFLGMALSEIINKQKEEKMNKNEVVLPDGTHEIAGKIYTVVNGKFESVKDKEEMAEEEVIEEVVLEEEEEVEEIVLEEEEEVIVEEELADEVIEEIVEEVVESYSKDEVDAKFDELYKLIADMEVKPTDEEIDEEIVELSAHERVMAFSRFTKSLK